MVSDKGNRKMAASKNSGLSAYDCKVISTKLMLVHWCVFPVLKRLVETDMKDTHFKASSQLVHFIKICTKNKCGIVCKFHDDSL